MLNSHQSDLQKSVLGIAKPRIGPPDSGNRSIDLCIFTQSRVISRIPGKSRLRPAALSPTSPWRIRGNEAHNIPPERFETPAVEGAPRHEPVNVGRIAIRVPEVSECVEVVGDSGVNDAPPAL